MQLVLSAISAGGLIGAADQYLCLLVISVAANQKWIKLAPEMAFMEAEWFMAIVGLFWIVTVAPAYSTLVAPGVMNAINTVINFLSGFVVPVSAIMVSLASAGVITNMHPETQHMVQTLQLFDPNGDLQKTDLMIAGGSALVATLLTLTKGLAKPAISTATGTVGHVSAPIYATLENIAALLLMGLVYVLINIDPWLLVVLLAVVAVITLIVLAYSIYQLWRLGKGIGQLIRLIQTNPKAGWAVVTEFFVWGAGWFMSNNPTRGAIMISIWVGYGILWWIFFGLASLLPILLLFYLPLSVMVFAWIGIFSARALMRKFAIVKKRPPSRKGGRLPSVSPS